MFMGMEEGDINPLLPLLLVTMAMLLLLLWRTPPPLLSSAPGASLWTMCGSVGASPWVMWGRLGVVVEEAGCWSFFLFTFLSLALRFWNQIFTWRERAREREGEREMSWSE